MTFHMYPFADYTLGNTTDLRYFTIYRHLLSTAFYSIFVLDCYNENNTSLSTSNAVHSRDEYLIIFN